MPDISIFSDDAFSVSTLTAAINDQPHMPSRLGDMGLFDEEGIITTTVQIEKDGETLALVPAGERGTAGIVVEGSKRMLLPFNTVHLPQIAAIKADEVQGIRAFGSTTELQSVQELVNKRLAKMRRRIDATHEWHRIGAVKGQVLDADGARVLLDVYERFGLQQQVISFDLDKGDTKLRGKCAQLLDMLEDTLDGIAFSGVRVECGRNFWNTLVDHPAIAQTYLNTQLAGAMRNDPRENVEFGGILFERYRGKVGGMAYIGDDEAYAIPEGVPDLFLSRFAPADYMETVNTNGLPYYAKQEVMPFNKGVQIEAQSNPLHLCTRPRSVIRLTIRKLVA